MHRPSRTPFSPLALALAALTSLTFAARASAQPQPAEPAPAVEVSGAPGKGVTVNAGDDFSLNLRSRFQIRYQRDVPDAGDAQQRVNVNTARIWISGHVLAPELTYMLQLAVAGRDYRDGATSPIFDAYLDWKAHRDASLRVGQYFVPFDRLRTVREFALQMAERPRPVQELTLDRDVGVTLYSDHLFADTSMVAYRLGVFGGGGTNLTSGRDPGVLAVGRLELRPLGPIDDDSEGDLERRAEPGLALGAAFAANVNSDRVRSTTGGTFTAGTTDFLHAAGDLVFKWRGVALQAEYLWKKASDDVLTGVDEQGAAITEFTRSAHGWVLQASYTFDPPFELVGRLSRLYALDGTDPAFEAELDARGQEVGAALNYYLNGHRFKIQADWLARMPGDFEFGAADHAVHGQVDATF